ncbi:MAG: hypothetical protein ABH844_05940 [Candidatus Omnitrophota bacterium]
MRKVFFLLCGLYLIAGWQTAGADDITWSSGGDGAAWTDADNWFPSDEPSSLDDVVIDASSAAVVCSQTFEAKSIIVGGHQTSQLAIQNFVYGDISPAAGTSNAITNRNGGTIILRGSAGVVRVSGKYEDSEPAFSAEPSFLFWTG